MSVETTAHPPSARGNHPALRSCWHPVAYSDALGPARRRPICSRSRSSSGATRGDCVCLLRPVHSPRHGALARNGGGRRDRLPLSRLALRNERRVHGDPAARRSDPGPREGARDHVPLPGALRDGLGRARRAALAASGSAGARVRRLALGHVRAVCLAVRLLSAGRELHRLRPLPVRPSGAARGPGAPGRPQPRGADGRARPPLRDRPPEAPNTDDFPVFANEEVEQPERRSRYELHLPYTIVLRLGWGGEEGMLYFFASQPVARTSARDSSGSGATTTSISPTRSCATSRT